MTEIKFHSQTSRKIAAKLQKPEKEVRI